MVFWVNQNTTPAPWTPKAATAAGWASFGVFDMPSLATIAALRLNSAAPTSFIIENYATVGDNGGGIFVLNPSDTVTADNSGTIIVDAAKQRWVRITNGVITPQMFGAKGDGVTDDTGAIQAAIAFVGGLGGGAVVFSSAVYLYSQITLDGLNGVALIGSAAIGGTILRCTAAGAGVKFRSTSDCTAELITFDHKAGYAGSLVDASHKPASSVDTQGLYFRRCTFTSQGYNLYTAIGASLNQCTTVTFEGCKFVGLSHGVDGQDSGGASYSNVIRFINCQFSDNVGYCFNYLGQNWTFVGCNFEPAHDGTQKIAYSTSPQVWRGLTFVNCSLYDASAGGGSYLNLGAGSGLNIIGGQWAGRSDLSATTCLNATGPITGLNVKGARFSLFTNVAVAGVGGNVGWDISGGNIFVSCTTIVNTPANVAGLCLDLNSPNSSLGTFVQSGWIRYNQDGTIEQGGIVSSVAPNATRTLTFPTAFPTACLSVNYMLITPATTTNILSLVGAPSATQSQYYINGTGNQDVMWRAVGV